MKLVWTLGDIADARSDALLVSFDGSTRAPDGSPAWGNVGFAIRRRWPELWDEVDDLLELPVGLGTTQLVEVADAGVELPEGLQVVGAMSTLDHRSGAAARFPALARRALGRALDGLRAFSVGTVAMVLPVGGWRVTPPSAVDIVDAVRADGAGRGMVVHVFERDATRHATLSPELAGRGWEAP